MTVEAELARLEEHLLWCHTCLDRVEAAEDYVDHLRIALLRANDASPLSPRAQVLMLNSMKSLDTLGHGGKRTTFSYEGSAAVGVKVLFKSQTAVIDGDFFRAALRHFAGRRVAGGFSMTDPTPGGFGEWVRVESPDLNSMKLTPRHASFMAAILCHEAGVERDREGVAVYLKFPPAAEE